jgi:hypothetical protein
MACTSSELAIPNFITPLCFSSLQRIALDQAQTEATNKQLEQVSLPGKAAYFEHMDVLLVLMPACTFYLILLKHASKHLKPLQG